jgi:hypothetical protein
MIEKIISGGQSGVDLLAIGFSITNGIECEINVEKAYKPLNNGIIPKGVPINVVSDKRGYSGGWIERRRYNIIESDFTLIFVRNNIYKTRGSLGTMHDCKKLYKPFSYITLSTVDSIDVGIVINSLEQNDVKILNIAGERSLNNVQRDKMVRFLNMIVLGAEISNFDE